MLKYSSVKSSSKGSLAHASHAHAWPSQDGVDRSDHMAVLLFLAPIGDRSPGDVDSSNDGPIFWEMQDALETGFRDAISELGLKNLSVESSIYLYGPQAQSWLSIISTIVDHKDQALVVASVTADLITIATVVNAIKNRVHDLSAKISSRRLGVKLVFPPSILAVLCESHVRSSFHPRARLDTLWISRTTEFYDGFRSPAHPGPDMEYIVFVSTSTNDYIFEIDGCAHVQMLRMRGQDGWKVLPAPDLLRDLVPETE